eukprot:Sspe_Gene.76416::Locus_47742_Transcript_1_1_Confidence_1.000_Length_793::g.76416::m.76416
MPPLQKKELWLVRHAEGEHNVSKRYTFDPPLTKDGWAQADDCRNAFLREGAAPEAMDLVCVSPLRRTLETAQALFGGGSRGPPMLAIEDLRERVFSRCNWRRPREVQQKAFPRVDFGSIEWGEDPCLDWLDETPEEVRDRCAVFLRWLARQPEHRVAVVTHWQVLFHGLIPLLDPSAERKDRSFHNCRVHRVMWTYELQR